MNELDKMKERLAIISNVTDALRSLNFTFTDEWKKDIINTINSILANQKIHIGLVNMTDEYKKLEMKKHLLYEKHKNDYKDLQSDHHLVNVIKPLKEEDFQFDVEKPNNIFDIETYMVRLDPIAFQYHMLGYAKLHEETKQFVFKIGGML